MHFATRVQSGLLTALSLFSAPLAVISQQTTSTASATVVRTGSVVDSTNSVVPRAHIKLERPGAGFIQFQTDARGAFLIKVDQPQNTTQTYTLTVTAAGFEPHTESLALGPGPSSTLIIPLSVQHASE